jgi:hypothetical protein
VVPSFDGKVKDSELQKKTEKQVDKFRQVAREVEADMDEKSFDQAVGKLAKQTKEEPPPPPKTKRRKGS